MKNKFEAPTLIIVSFDDSDIITYSEPGDIWRYHEINPLEEEENL